MSRVNWQTRSYFSFAALSDPATRPDGVKRADVEVAAFKGAAGIAPEVQLQNAQEIASERIGPVALIAVAWAGATDSGSITGATKAAASALCTQTGFPLALLD